MRRVALLFVIISMCILVAIGGTFTFLESNSVLKQKRSIEVLKPVKNISLLIDEYTGKIYVLYDNKITKSYIIKDCMAYSSFPEGNWAVNGKYVWNHSFGIIINTGWGYYIIHGENHAFKINNNAILGCIKLLNKDMLEIYKDVQYGTQIRIEKYNKIFNKYKVLKVGDIGWEVFEIQNKLKKLGYYSGYPNGIYDNNLKASVNNYQKNNGLEVKSCFGYDFYNNLDEKFILNP
ncbi:hypothetical protein FDN13_11390 [Caloramator sp. E03]|uniref:peptidoglycan-binding protein n=1 Tax=Caloramator sp. E03 TaxID=2576307 RepID=UPI0011104E43|nr:peptidoglycan-binding protein [Caloramator sp. E03]QCX34254.1 hypothetical protein FDN13_11390 [Caloramator sp. E03]